MKALFVGLGSIGQRHARNLRTLLGQDVELLAYRVRGLSHVITPRLTIAEGEDVEAALGIRVHRDLDAALAERPDVVFVTNPNTLHVPVAIAAANAGCHLFLEKPISHDLTGVDELLNVIERRRTICLVAYQLRFHPGFRALQRMLAARAIGRIIMTRVTFGEYLPGWHPYEDYRTMHVSRRELGGGVLLAQIHDLDAIFAHLDRTSSGLGAQVLYHRLRSAPAAPHLPAFDALAERFQANAAVREQAQATLEMLQNAAVLDVWRLTEPGALTHEPWQRVRPGRSGGQAHQPPGDESHERPP